MDPKPILILDLDNTLFETVFPDDHRHMIHALEPVKQEYAVERPYLTEFLDKMSEKYFLCVFTRGTFAYALGKCSQLGILSYIPVDRIYAREETIDDRKRFEIVLCSECIQRAVAVDDTPEVWENVDGSRARVFEWTDILYKKEIKAKSVIEIPAFHANMKNDRALEHLAVFMNSCVITKTRTNAKHISQF